MFFPADILENCVFEQVDPQRFPLIDRFYAGCKYRIKCSRSERIYSLLYNNEIIAAARLIPQPSGHFLLRNLCVSPFMRQQGIGKRFVELIVTALAPVNCYCYALSHLQQFYLTLNFKCLKPEDAPSDIGDIYRRHQSRGRDWLLMGFINAPYRQTQLATSVTIDII